MPRSAAVRVAMTRFDRILNRVAIGVLVLATAWLAFTAAWGMCAIPGGGHLGAGNAGTLMAAEQIVRWKIPYPARIWYSPIRPEGAQLMCHHPYGQYYVPALLYWLFGHHDGLNHLPAALMSACIPPLLYGIGKERWGAPFGAIAAAGYVVVPIAVGFSSYWNLETICIFGALLFFWGHSRHLTTGRHRYLVASLVGLGFVCSGDWIGFVLVGPTLLWALLRAFLLPERATPAFRLMPYARWWTLSVVIAAAELTLWVGLFAQAGQIGQWLGAAGSRGGGGVGTIAQALTDRRAWIDFSFTPLAIAIGKVAAPVCLLRLIVLRRDEETYALGILFGAVVQYVSFRKGADVHIFWPHYFAAYFALALAELTKTAAQLASRFATRIGRPAWSRSVAVAALISGLLPVAAMAHDAVASLWVWRRTGGRYDEHGSAIRSQVELLTVLRQVVYAHVPPGTTIDAHPSIGWGWEFLWTAQGLANPRNAPAASPPGGAPHPFWVARASGLTGNDQRAIAASAPVRVYGDEWIVDERQPPAPLDAFAIDEREPNPLEWLVYGGTEPMRTVGARPDPWLTWEWRTHLAEPSPEPAGEPISLDQIRIAHNLAVARGDGEAIDRWRAAIDRAIDRRVTGAFTNGTELIGVRLVDGVEPKLESWFAVSPTASTVGQAWFSVRSKVEARAAWSLIPPSPTDREMAFAPSLPTELWRPRFIYAISTVLNHRIGRELYAGTWRSRDGSRDPRRIDGQPDTTLLVLP